MTPLKVKYPSGLPLDDLDVGQRYKLTLRGGHVLLADLCEIKLIRHVVPLLIVLVVGAPHRNAFFVDKIARIELAEVDLRNADYSRDGGELGGECGGA